MSHHITGSPQVAVQVRDINGGGVHIHTPPPTPPPRQLPAPRLFLDRDQARKHLEHAWATRHGPMRVGIEGPSGVGKTALVTAWAHEHHHRWPDGALYTDLSRTTVDSALWGWLLALGYTHPPQDPDQLRALWRTATTDRALLAIVENTTAKATEDLFPAGVDCAGVITAHHGLSEIVATGGRYIPLAGLPDTTVGDLITQLVGQPLPAPLIREAVTTAGGLPLAATLTAAVLTRTLTTPLAEDQENVVSRRIDQILTELPDDLTDTAAMVSAFPGPTVTDDLVAALMDTTLAQARHSLSELVDTALLTDLGQGRYTVHDQAREPLTERLTTEARHRMIDRAAQWYRLRAAAVGWVMNPWRWRVDTEGVDQATSAQEQGAWFADERAAIAWADTHLDNIVTLSGVLTDLGRPEPWQYADHLGPYIIARKPMDAAYRLYELGLETALALGPKEAEGLMYQRWGALVHYRTGPQETPSDEGRRLLGYAEKALSAYRQAEYPRGIASALETLGGAYRAMGELDRAAETFAESERLNLEVEEHRGAALQRRKRGEMAADQADLVTALGLWTDAHRTLLGLEEPDLYQAGRALQGLTSAVLATESTDPVMLALVEMLCHQGLTGARTVGSIHQEAGLRITLADLAHLRGDRGREEEELQRALVLLEPTGHTQAEEIRERILAPKA